MANQLRLLADSYEQPQKDDDPRGVRSLVTYTKGDTFEPVNAAEADRLVEIGAAVDPAKQAEQERADAEARIEQIKAEQAALEDQLAEAQPVEDLTVEQLRDKAAGLGIEDVSGLKKAELVEAIRSQS